MNQQPTCSGCLVALVTCFGVGYGVAGARGGLTSMGLFALAVIAMLLWRLIKASP